jgi:hypothetical protein
VHATQLIAEIRALPPEDGWSRFEQTGRACAVCPCGLNTGFVDTSHAIAAYRSHIAPKQKVVVDLAGGGKTLSSFLRDAMRKR